MDEYGDIRDEFTPEELPEELGEFESEEDE